MKKRILRTTTGLALIAALAGCCSPREAATVGAVIARPFGYALGITGVAIDETFQTADDVIDANPRYADRPWSCAGPRRIEPCRTVSEAGVGDRYFYETTLLVETEGPANIRSVRLEDAEDVTAFWQ